MNLKLPRIIELLTSLRADQIVFVALAAAAVFAFFFGVFALVSSARDPRRRRLAQVAREHAPDPPRRPRLASRLRPLAALVLPRREADKSRVSRLLMHAGYRSAHSVSTFYAVKALCIVALPVAVLLSWSLFPTVTPGRLMFYAAVAGFLGSLLPSMWLDRRVLSRQRGLRAGFPDALDLLVVCVEAGLGLAPAVQRVAEELAFSHPALGAELTLVNAEIRAGVDRAQALRNLADRTGLTDIRGLVALMAQTMRFGTSIADALRVYAEEFRDKRMQAAEEQSAKIGTKMIFPLVLCLFPAFFIVAIGPAALRLIAAFTQLSRLGR